MATRLAGKVAIVTGSRQGIGRAVAIAFAREGAVVVIATRTLRLIEAAGGKAIFRQIDLADHDAARAMVDEAGAARSRLDIMAHNAAAFGRRSIEEMDHETLDRTDCPLHPGQTSRSPGGNRRPDGVPRA